MDARERALATLVQAGVIAIVVLLVLLVLHAAEVFLVIFAGILFAVLFHHSALWLHERTGLPHGWAIALTVIGPLAIVSGGFWLAAPEIASQASKLAEQAPSAVRQLEEQMLRYEWVSTLMEHQERLRKAVPSGSDAASAAAGFFTSTFGALGNLIIALAVGLFLAVSPAIYVRGLVKLTPLQRRPRVTQVLQETSSALASWLIAKITAMAVIGGLTTVGLWLIGIDLALVLGLIAALLSFIPNVGPVIALFPALLIALIGGSDQVIYVLVLYIGIQTFESYLLTPLLQQRMVDLPPALIIGMQVLLGFLAGILGVILATPLTAAAMVMIRMWYIEDTLGDRNQDGADQECKPQSNGKG